MKLFGPSLHIVMNNQYALELQIECENPQGKKIVILVLFKESKQKGISNHFLRGLNVGTGKIKSFKVDEPIKVIKTIFYIK